MANAQHSSATDEHYTPPEITKRSRVVMGPRGILLDPASDDRGNWYVGAKRIFDRGEDGLSQRWEADTIFVNPPGGTRVIGVTKRQQSNQRLWWEKAVDEYRAGKSRRSILFLAFSIELFARGQQTDGYPAPYEFPFVVFRDRLRFWITVRTKITQLEAKLSKAKSISDNAKLNEQIASYSLDDPDQLIPGDQPTHANALILLPSVGDPRIKTRFKNEFQDMGKVRL